MGLGTTLTHATAVQSNNANDDSVLDSVRQTPCSISVAAVVTVGGEVVAVVVMLLLCLLCDGDAGHVCIGSCSVAVPAPAMVAAAAVLDAPCCSLICAVEVL